MLFVVMLCMIEHEFVEIFDEHIMFVFIFSDQKQFHMIIKFLFRNINRVWLFIFITENTDAYVVLLFNFIDLFNGDWKFNVFVI